MKNKSGNTAFGAAAVRLEEQYEPQEKRLFDDSVVYHLTNDASRFMLKFKLMRNFINHFSEKIAPGVIGGQICRTKYIDEKTLGLLNKVQQILILGAGLDTRAYRLEGIENIKIFEVDLPNIQQIKKRKLKKYLGGFPSNVTFIPIDFNKEKLETVLNNSSFDYTKQTLVILEAVTQYVDGNAVSDVFRFISKLSNNSYLIFTYVLRDVIERKSEEAKKIMYWTEKNHSPFVWGINPTEIKSFLQKYNLEMIEDVGAEYYQKNYLEPINREIVVFEGERISFSRVKK